ncbi:MAG: SpoIIE family protein phosphatase [Bdellovibrionales bacterium]
MTLTAIECDVVITNSVLGLWLTPIVMEDQANVIDAVGLTGQPLGASTERPQRYEQDLSEIKKMYLVTDGILETEKHDTKKELGLKKFVRMVKKNTQRPVDDFISTIVSEVDEYRGEFDQDDDYTLVGVEFTL